MRGSINLPIQIIAVDQLNNKLLKVVHKTQITILIYFEQLKLQITILVD